MDSEDEARDSYFRPDDQPTVGARAFFDILYNIKLNAAVATAEEYSEANWNIGVHALLLETVFSQRPPPDGPDVAPTARVVAAQAATI